MDPLQTTSPEVQDALEFKNKPEQALETATQGLEKFGGFDLLESMIDGVQNVNPVRKARRKIFIEEAAKRSEREELKKTLQWWVEVLNSSENLGDMVQGCQEASTNADQLLKKNLRNAIEQTKELERSYRSAALFYKNTESAKVKNVSLIN